MENDITKLQMQDLERRVQMLENTVQSLLWEKPFSDDPDRKVNGLVRDYGEFITKTQAAEILGVTRATVYAMLADGRIKGACSGRKVSTRSVGSYIFGPGWKKKASKSDESNA